MIVDLPLSWGVFRWLPRQRCNRIPADPDSPVACRCLETMRIINALALLDAESGRAAA